jgi:circadian clock protein KaiB
VARPRRRRSGPRAGSSPSHVFKLYLTGGAAPSEHALANLRRLCDDALGGDCRIDVIDVLEQPHLAEQEHVLVTPTLIKQEPPPLRRVLGDLSDLERVLAALQLRRVEPPPSPTALT